MTREQWLEQAVEELKADFQRIGQTVPRVRVSTGFTGSRGSKLKVLGACWHPKAADDQVPQIFISPTLDDSVRCLDVLVHELTHAVVGIEAKHGPAFKRVALAIGLTGKMTATVAGPELSQRLNALVEKLGPYPHAKLNPADSGIKKQGTRMLKVQCPDCEYTVRASRKVLDLGMPLCGVCELRMIEVSDE